MTNTRDVLYNDFINIKWDVHKVYDPKYFEKLFNMTNREVRYYLDKYVTKGVLCRVKIESNVYYAKSEWFEILKKYNKLDGIKVS